MTRRKEPPPPLEGRWEVRTKENGKPGLYHTGLKAFAAVTGTREELERYANAWNTRAGLQKREEWP